MVFITLVTGHQLQTIKAAAEEDSESSLFAPYQYFQLTDSLLAYLLNEVVLCNGNTTITTTTTSTHCVKTHPVQPAVLIESHTQ